MKNVDDCIDRAELATCATFVFSLRGCLNFAHDPLSKARGVQPTRIETSWPFFGAMFFPMALACGTLTLIFFLLVGSHLWFTYETL